MDANSNKPASVLDLFQNGIVTFVRKNRVFFAIVAILALLTAGLNVNIGYVDACGTYHPTATPRPTQPPISECDATATAQSTSTHVVVATSTPKPTHVKKTPTTKPTDMPATATIVVPTTAVPSTSTPVPSTGTPVPPTATNIPATSTPIEPTKGATPTIPPVPTETTPVQTATEPPEIYHPTFDLHQSVCQYQSNPLWVNFWTTGEDTLQNVVLTDETTGKVLDNSKGMSFDWESLANHTIRADASFLNGINQAWVKVPEFGKIPGGGECKFPVTQTPTATPTVIVSQTATPTLVPNETTKEDFIPETPTTIPTQVQAFKAEQVCDSIVCNPCLEWILVHFGNFAKWVLIGLSAFLRWFFTDLVGLVKWLLSEADPWRMIILFLGVACIIRAINPKPIFWFINEQIHRIK